MDALPILLIGALLTIIFIVNNLLRTALRQKELRWIEGFLALAVALFPVSALLIDNLETSRFDQLEQITLLLIIPLAIIHVGLMIVELFRQQRLRQSRGILGIGLAVVLLIATVSYNFVSINAQLTAVERNIRPSPVNAVVSPCELAFAEQLVGGVELLLEETGLTTEELVERFFGDLDFSIDDLVDAGAGSTTALTRDLNSYIATAVPDLLAQGCLEQSQASPILSGVALLPALLRTNIEEYPLLVPIPGIERATLEPLGNDPQQRVTADALVAFLNQEPTITPTITPTPTATITPSPTFTRTALPTPSVTPTRERFMTATLPPEPTRSNETCAATTGANLNLRDLPDVENGQILLTIPVGTRINLFGPNPERTWWLALYNDAEGWVSADFITRDNTCGALVPIEP